MSDPGNDRPEPQEEPPAEPRPPERKRLVRSRSDRMLAGVAGGLGKHFDVDSADLPDRVRRLALLRRLRRGRLPRAGPVPARRVGRAARRRAPDRALAHARDRRCSASSSSPPSAGDLRRRTVLVRRRALVLGGRCVLIAILAALFYLRAATATAATTPGADRRDDRDRHRAASGRQRASSSLAAWAASRRSARRDRRRLVIVARRPARHRGAFRGGLRWLIIPALALATRRRVAAASTSRSTAAIGQREHTPLRADEIPADGYELGIGSARRSTCASSTGARHEVVELDVDLGIGQAERPGPRERLRHARRRGQERLAGRSRGEQQEGGFDVDIPERCRHHGHPAPGAHRRDVQIGESRAC